MLSSDAALIKEQKSEYHWLKKNVSPYLIGR